MAQLWTLRGNLHFPRGELDACLRAHGRALEYARQAAAPEDIARALGGLGDAQYQRGRMHTAHAEFSRCVSLCEEHGLAGLRLSYLPMVATTEAYLGNFESALEISGRGEAAAAQAGDLRTQLLSQSLRAMVEIYRANYRQALSSSERGVSLAREIGARRFEAEALALRGLAARGLGDHAFAQESLAGSVAIAREAARTYCGPWALSSLALATDDPARSRALLDEGEHWLADGCVSHNYLEFYRHAIEVSLRSGDWDRAESYADALEAYTRDERLPWADLVIGAGRLLARTGCAAPGAKARNDQDALLAEARRMQFNEIATLIAGGSRP